MAIARTFRDLKVYQLAEEAAQIIFMLSRQFPVEERYSLTDQVRRSSRAVKAMVAEAWGRRRYKAIFINKIDEALSLDQFNALDSKYTSIGQMLSRMIDRADDFCKHAPSTDYRALSPRVTEIESSADALPIVDEFFK
jgi:hypothetical protein